MKKRLYAALALVALAIALFPAAAFADGQVDLQPGEGASAIWIDRDANKTAHAILPGEELQLASGFWWANNDWIIVFTTEMADELGFSFEWSIDPNSQADVSLNASGVNATVAAALTSAEGDFTVRVKIKDSEGRPFAEVHETYRVSFDYYQLNLDKSEAALGNVLPTKTSPTVGTSLKRFRFSDGQPTHVVLDNDAYAINVTQTNGDDLTFKSGLNNDFQFTRGGNQESAFEVTAALAAGKADIEPIQVNLGFIDFNTPAFEGNRVDFYEGHGVEALFNMNELDDNGEPAFDYSQIQMLISVDVDNVFHNTATYDLTDILNGTAKDISIDENGILHIALTPENREEFVQAGFDHLMLGIEFIVKGTDVVIGGCHGDSYYIELAESEYGFLDERWDAFPGDEWQFPATGGGWVRDFYAPDTEDAGYAIRDVSIQNPEGKTVATAELNTEGNFWVVKAKNFGEATATVSFNLIRNIGNAPDETLYQMQIPINIAKQRYDLNLTFRSANGGNSDRMVPGGSISVSPRVTLCRYNQPELVYPGALGDSITVSWTCEDEEYAKQFVKWSVKGGLLTVTAKTGIELNGDEWIPFAITVKDASGAIVAEDHRSVCVTPENLNFQAEDAYVLEASGSLKIEEPAVMYEFVDEQGAVQSIDVSGLYYMELRLDWFDDNGGRKDCIVETTKDPNTEETFLVMDENDSVTLKDGATDADFPWRAQVEIIATLRDNAAEIVQSMGFSADAVDRLDYRFNTYSQLLICSGHEYVYSCSADANHSADYYQCENCGYGFWGDAHEHSWAGSVMMKATLSSPGIMLNRCSVCKDVSADLIPSPKTFKLSTTAYTYTGAACKPAVTVKDTTGATILPENYTVTYANNTKAGKATAKVTFTGDAYTGTKSVTFTINPAKPTISALTAGSKSFTVKAAKTAAKYGAAGFEVSYKVKGAGTYKTAKFTAQSKKITGLAKGKTYQVRIRPYAKVGTTYYYGAYSATKTVKVK